MRISGNIDAGDNDNLRSFFNKEEMISDLTIDLPTGFFAGQSVIMGL
jgi:hypothetical protein